MRVSRDLGPVIGLIVFVAVVVMVSRYTRVVPSANEAPTARDSALVATSPSSEVSDRERAVADEFYVPPTVSSATMDAFSICGLKPGMRRREIEMRLGPAESERPTCGLTERLTEVVWPSLTGTEKVSCFFNVRGICVRVIGCTLEREGKPFVQRGDAFSKIAAIVGDPSKGRSSCPQYVSPKTWMDVEINDFLKGRPLNRFYLYFPTRSKAWEQ